MSSKLTIYDFLTQFIPGFLILFLLIPDNIGDHNQIFLFVIILTLGMAYHRLVEIISKVCIFPKPLDMILLSRAKTKLDVDKKNEYIKAYYTVFKSQSVNSVSVLEAHYCFIKNLLPILLIYMILNWCNILHIAEHLHNFLNYFLPIIVIALSLVNIYIRYKTYELIFQAEYFLKHEKDCGADNISK